MSTKSTTIRGKSRNSTDPKWYPVTSKFGSWERAMTGRSDLAIGVVRDTSGAPARYNPASAEIELNEGMVEHLTPMQVGAPDFIYRHASLAGAMVHEGAHARFSGMNLEKLHRAHGGKWLTVFAMLEEARCERQQLPNLKPHEKAALTACVLEIVLRDTNPDETDSGAAALQLVGLMAGRIAAKTIDLKREAMLAKCWAKVRSILGVDRFNEFVSLAVNFSELEWSDTYWGRERNDQMLDEADTIITRWLELEAEMKADDNPGDGPGEPGDEPGEPGDKPGEGGGKGEGDGESSDSESEPGDGEPGEGDGEGDGEGEGNGPGKSQPKRDGSAGDSGKQHDAGDDVTVTKEGTGDNSRGDYGSGHFETEDADEADIIEMTKALREAAGVVMDQIKDNEITIEVKALTKANAEAQAHRRALNKAAKARWKK